MSSSFKYRIGECIIKHITVKEIFTNELRSWWQMIVKFLECLSYVHTQVTLRWEQQGLSLVIILIQLYYNSSVGICVV